MTWCGICGRRLADGEPCQCARAERSNLATFGIVLALTGDPRAAARHVRERGRQPS